MERNEFINYLEPKGIREVNFGKKSLTELEEWNRGFWLLKKSDIDAVFAQKGFEDKGFGHSERIIANVSLFLDKYITTLMGISKLNVFDSSVKNRYRDEFKHTYLLFYSLAHLHDIGIKCAGIYEALNKLINAGGDLALHVGEIIYDYHHYSTFIVLLEISPLFIESVPQNLEEDIDLNVILESTTYLKKLYEITKDDEIKYLFTLRNKIIAIFDDYFKDDFIGKVNIEDFFILLALLSLFHKSTKYEFCQSILRKLTGGKQDKLEKITQWWDFFKRSETWTNELKKKMPKPGEKPIIGLFSGWKNIIIERNGNYLNLVLAEALLQYGDKTEISIARLARPITIKKDSNEKNSQNSTNSNEVIPLEEYIKNIEYDNIDGLICTDMAQRRISQYARYRACRFIPVLYVDVDEDPQYVVNVIIYYMRFKGDREIFRLLRYKNEKDFYDLDFLNNIQVHLYMMFSLRELSKKMNSKKHLESGFLKLKLLKKEDNFPPQNLEKIATLKNTLDAIEKIERHIENEDQAKIEPANKFPYTLRNRQAVRENSQDILNPEARKRNQGTKKVFESVDDLVIPMGFDLMAVLNLFNEEV